MTNFDTPTGNAGTLRITDDGSVVGYWILCGDPSTHVGSVGWNGSINGRNVGGSVSLGAGFGEVLVLAEIVSASQTVLFNMFATGTGGLGGPTGHSAYIGRGPAPTVPATIAAPAVSEQQANSMRVTWATPADGGAALDGILLRAYPTAELDFSMPTKNYTLAPGATTHVPTDLERATPYWWTVYAHNAMGYSAQSPATLGRTLGGVHVGDGAAWKDAELLVSDGAAWRPAEALVSDGAAWKAGG